MVECKWKFEYSVASFSELLYILCIGNEVFPWVKIPKPLLMLMTSANFTQKLSAFLFV